MAVGLSYALWWVGCSQLELCVVWGSPSSVLTENTPPAPQLPKAWAPTPNMLL